MEQMGIIRSGPSSKPKLKAKEGITMSNKKNLLCMLGIHIEKFLSNDVTDGSKCSCGKKCSPKIIWPNEQQIKIITCPICSGELQEILKGFKCMKCSRYYSENKIVTSN